MREENAYQTTQKNPDQLFMMMWRYINKERFDKFIVNLSVGFYKDFLHYSFRAEDINIFRFGTKSLNFPYKTIRTKIQDNKLFQIIIDYVLYSTNANISIDDFATNRTDLFFKLRDVNKKHFSFSYPALFFYIRHEFLFLLLFLN